jgi:hypothetical protein
MGLQGMINAWSSAPTSTRHEGAIDVLARRCRG